MWAFEFRFYMSGSMWDPDTITCGIARGTLASSMCLFPFSGNI